MDVFKELQKNVVQPVTQLYYSLLLKETIMADTKELKVMSLEELMEGSLDDLADMPEFKPYPIGVHLITGKLEWKPGNGKDKNGNPKSGGFMWMMEAIETKELADPNGEPVSKGQKTGIYFNMGNEFGQGGFKMILAAAAAKWGAGKNKDLIAKINDGSQALVVTSQRADKENKAIVRTMLDEISFDV